MIVASRRTRVTAGALIVLGASFLIPLIVALAAPAATAKSFVFTRVAIDAAVGTDGSLRIIEARTYAFNGDFTWASYRLPLEPHHRVEEILVSDERGAYSLSGARSPGTYEFRRSNTAVEIRWQFRASNESKTFTIAYVVRNVVIAYSDVAELYWKFIGTGWDRPARDVRIDVRLPGNLPAEKIRAWGHGPLHGNVRPVAGGAVLTVRNLPPATMVEGRIVFPNEAVPQTRMRLTSPGLPRILREETAWADEANLTRRKQQALLGGLLAAPVLALGGWLGLYMRFGREPVPAPPEGYYRELPADYSPAELGVLWRFESIQPADFTATILDLIRRGYLTVEVTGSDTDSTRDDQYILSRTKKADGLRGFEEEALHILFGSNDAQGASLIVSGRTGLPEDAKSRMRARFPIWRSVVAKAARVHGFFDTTSMRWRWLAGALGIIAAFGLGWLVIALWTSVGTLIKGVGLLGVLSSLVLAGGSGAVARRSQRGADDLRRWQGFRRFLLDFSEMPRAELPSLIVWEHYLVYAVPLGVANRVVEQLHKIYPAEELSSSPGLQPWVSSSRGSGVGAGSDPLGSFSAFTTAFASATSSASSGSGGGGGFSGGGGGGGGGGSGGSAG